MQRRLAALVMVVLILSLGALPAAAAPWWNTDAFASDGFARQWSRTDAEAVREGRSLYWGTSPWFDYYEFYRESPHGLRLIQYFDKARMELNNPEAQTVTNGLLVVEMVGGQQKLGDRPDDVANVGAARVPVAGDPAEANAEAATYASFTDVSTVSGPGEHRDPHRVGQVVASAIDLRGRAADRPELAATNETEAKIARYVEETGHNIPAVFWTYLHQTGPVIVNDQVRRDVVVDWVSAMGFPISDPYWVRTRVGGQEKDVLVQLFERRVLTYTPSNAPGFKVEMGNVGQHYFAWRYPSLGPKWAVTSWLSELFFASSRGGNHWEVYGLGQEYMGNWPIRQLTTEKHETVPYSIHRSHGTNYVLVDSRRSDGKHRQLYVLSTVSRYPTPGVESLRLTYSDGTPPPAGIPFPTSVRAANDYNPAVSPDGSKVAFVSDRAGKAQLYVMGYRPEPLGTVGEPAQLTEDDCTNQAPSWSPDGRTLIWMSDCDGDFDIMQADLAYEEDSRTNTGRYFQHQVKAKLINVRRITNNTSDDLFSRYSPDGASIAFEGKREGITSIYLMDRNGSRVRRLTSTAYDESAPSWSPDGRQLVFAAKQGANWRLAVARVDGSALQVVNRDGPGDDRWPAWFQ